MLYYIYNIMSSNKFMKCQETFNPDYLDYIINNFELFKTKLRWRERYDTIDPFIIMKKYLYRSRNGNVVVDYKQNNGNGRFCAISSMSLQTIPREIRQTICKDYYIDIDMQNAHPIILEWLCKKNDFECKELSNYILNRDELLKKVKFNGEYSKDKAKQVYLSLTNGGVKDYQSSDDIKEKDIRDIETLNDDLTRYKNEMIRLHRLFSQLEPEKFNEIKDKRKNANKDYNHEAGYMNTLLCDMENNLLQEMYKYFESPFNCVLCFDGIMLRNDKKYDIIGCENYIKKKYNMNLFKLTIKEMNEGINMLSYNIPKYEYFKLDYYVDFRNLIREDDIYEEWLQEWVNNSLKLIENDGKQYFITRNKRVIIFSDKTQEIRDEWKPIKTEEIEKSLKIKIKTKNIFYDYNYHQKYKAMKTKEQKSISMSKDKLNKLINYYSYTTLGNSCSKLGNGYLSYLMEERKIECYNSIDFYPLLQRCNNIPLIDTFNIFTKYPFENEEIKKNINFEESLLYKHLKTDFFNNDPNELNHFLDHIADLIQDPARIKGTSHLFYSPQGCGKGLLYKFMSKLLGISNVISIINTDLYFDKNFNSDIGNKLLKVFEEVSEKGSAFKNHNRLKGEQTSETERIEPKGMDAYYNRHCARFWYFTNNENSLYIENDDRRHTLHKISNKHQNNYEYFKPIWDEIKDVEFLKNAFEYFSIRKYDEKNVMNAYTTQYKKEQKDSNLPNGIKFILEYICKAIPQIEDKDIKITSDKIKNKYKDFCIDRGIKYHLGTLNTQIKKIGILEPTQLNVKSEDGTTIKKFCYKINTFKLQEEMKRYLQDTNYKLGIINNNEIEEVNEKDVIGNYSTNLI